MVKVIAQGHIIGIPTYRFHSMLISPPIPEMPLFKKLTLKIQGQGHG